LVKNGKDQVLAPVEDQNHIGKFSQPFVLNIKAMSKVLHKGASSFAVDILLVFLCEDAESVSGYFILGC
jgi:hypothetical protein